MLDEETKEYFDEKFSNQSMKINELRSYVESGFSKMRSDIKSINRKLKELESNQRSADSILRNVVQGSGRRIEKAPYELQGHGFVEEIKDYY